MLFVAQFKHILVSIIIKLNLLHYRRKDGKRRCANGEGGKIVISTTFNRLKRMQELLEQNIGRIDVEMSKRFLSDHSGFPNSICVHGRECAPLLKTLSAMVFDLQDKKMHIAFGNASETVYNEYTFS